MNKDPDLIVATADLPEAVITQLEDLAPVVVLKSADASRQIDQSKDNLKLVAKATGTEAKADGPVLRLPPVAFAGGPDNLVARSPAKRRTLGKSILLSWLLKPCGRRV